jgi:hypothetical protein
MLRSTLFAFLLVMLNASPLAAQEKSFVLIVRTEGEGRGRVNVSPKADRYPEGAIVRLTAVSTGQNSFEGFRGDGFASSQVSITIVMDRDKEIVARFDRQAVIAVPRVQPGVIGVSLVEVATLPPTLHFVPGAPAKATVSSLGYFPAARITSLKPMRDRARRLLVNDQRGLLYTLAKDNQALLYLDVRAMTPLFKDNPGLTAGLNAIAVHPNFASNGLFYTVHSEMPSSQAVAFKSPTPLPDTCHFVLTEWRAENPDADSFHGRRREVLRIAAPACEHGMQDIDFDHAIRPGDPGYGLLYLLQGDGTSVWLGALANYDRTDAVLGTVLRIDPTPGNGWGGQYSIPPTNPWASDYDGKTFGEVWARGFRNPHKLSFDGHRLFVADVGESNVEEIDIVERGGNYGWPWREGTMAIDPRGRLAAVGPLGSPDDRPELIPPAAVFSHQDGSSVAGGFVYRGRSIPALTGMYVFGDIASGSLFYAPADEMRPGTQPLLRRLVLTRSGKPAVMRDYTGSDRADLHLGQDEDGEIYILTKIDGSIRRLAAQ